MTSIEWTDATWNPVRGCTRVSKGCEHCYAEGVARRFAGPGQPYEGLVRLDAKGKPKAQWNGEVRFVASKLAEPLSWRKPRRVFVNSMSDLFHEGLVFGQIAAVFGVMAASPRHTFQVLTKRPERAAAFFAWALRFGELRSDVLWRIRQHARWRGVDLGHLPTDLHANGIDWPLPNVWLGVSVEDQRTADERIPVLLTLPAAVRWVSYEPALGPVDFNAMSRTPGAAFDEITEDDDALGPPLGGVNGIDWVVVGGESGPGARPCALEWLSSTVAQCRAAGVPVFVKQLGACVVSEERVVDDPEEQRALGLSSRWAWGAGLRDPKGGDPSEWPEDLRVREWPEVRHA